MPSGIICNIYRDKTLSDCSLSGLSSKHDSVLLILSEDDKQYPFHPSDDLPAVRLESRKFRFGEFIRAVPVDPRYVRDSLPMMGGTFIYSCDSRFSEACGKVAGGYPVPLHDRYE